MTQKIQLRRGTSSALPTLSDGEPAWTSNNFQLWIGQDGVNKLVGGLSAVLTPGTYGDSTHVAQFVVDAQGKISSVASVAISAVSTPGGSDKQIQFNDAGTLAGNAGVTFNKTTGVFQVTNTVTAKLCPAATVAFLSTDGTRTVSLSDGVEAGNFSDGTRTVVLCDGTYALSTAQNVNAAKYYAGGTAPAVDGTYLSPTSITIKGGVITAIS